MIDRVVADIPNAEHGFTLIFAAAPFPGHQYKLDWVRADEDGGIGIAPQNSIWKAGSVRRCFRYFDEAPMHLYAQVKALGS